MKKDLIGDWGAELTDVEYGRALAALGVLEASGTEQHRASDDPQKLATALRKEFEDGERTVVWRGAKRTDGTTPVWQQTVHKNARALAEAWGILLNVDHPRRKPRLAIEAGWRHRPDLFDIEALFGWLGRPENECQALVLAPDAPEGRPPRLLWHWPLQIGVPATPEGEALFAAMRDLNSGWVGELGLPMLVGEGRDKCDLLILPPGMAEILVKQPRLRLQASFIVALDKPVEWREAPETPHAELRARMGAAGIALVGHPGDFDFRYWYRELIRELSHDLPLHAALWGIGVWRVRILPTIMGLPPALDRLRILAVAERVDRRIKRTLPPRERSEFGYPGSSLSDRARARLFVSEQTDGVPEAREIGYTEAGLDQRRRLRWIQAHAWRGDTGAGPARALAPERPNLLAIHIGPSAKIRKDRPFPDQRFDFADGPVGISVQVELAEAWS